MHDSPVLILGAGVHGAAIALELVLNGVPVCVVDAFDLAFGATSKSSRLIHGGLRYLEYGDFQLVRESLEARRRNLDLAPQFVKPLQFYIPTSKRFSGLVRSAIGFFGGSRTSWGQPWTAAKAERGFWPLMAGLFLYGGMTSLPPSMVVGAPGAPRVNPNRYYWLLSYTDAQMLYPERLVVALLAEARQVAAEHGVPFEVCTYTAVEPRDGELVLRDTIAGGVCRPIRPQVVVNATGAWGDATLEELRIEHAGLFGGTKGTHLVTWNEQLRDALGGQAVYAEADDGRLVFVLPFGEAVLVGTTDETFAGSPEGAAATEEEIGYLLHLVNEVMDCRITREDVTLTYSGVRPLPKSNVADNAAVSRGHTIVERESLGKTVFTLVGGKLTTWREFGQEVSDRVLQRLGKSRRENCLNRPVLGAYDPAFEPDDPSSRRFPKSDEEQRACWKEWSEEFGASQELIAALWPLYGFRSATILRDCQGHWGGPISGTPFTMAVVRWVIEREWVRTLSDLVERRLMLVFARHLSRQTLSELATCLVESGRLSAEKAADDLQSAIDRLQTYYSRRLDDPPAA
jgi:glycerol-3-phosphate dehydrogenase